MKRIIMMLLGVPRRDTNEGNSAIYSSEEIDTRRSRSRKHEERQQPRGFTVESAAEMIDDMPADVPHESAVRIVRGALTAAGIEVSELERFTRVRMSKLSSEIELAQNRQKKFQEETEETVRSLQEEIRKLRETCDTVLAEEKKKLSRASGALKEVRRVYAFFDFPQTGGEENIGPTAEDTQPLEAISTQLRRHGSSSAATEYSKAWVDLKSLSTSYEPLPIVEIDEFEEFIARLRREGRHTQEAAQFTDKRSEDTVRPTEEVGSQIGSRESIDKAKATFIDEEKAPEKELIEQTADRPDGR